MKIVRNNEDNSYYVGTRVNPNNRVELVFTPNAKQAKVFLLDELAEETATYYGRKHKLNLSVIDPEAKKGA